jgi:DUF971 family protein
MTVPAPVDIKLHRQSRILEVGFEDGSRFELPCELLRVYSPSAEVRGHGPGQEILQIGKEQVNIDAIEPIGGYAVRLRFSDGHATGIYTWELLHNLGTHREQLWANYLEKLASAGHTRPPPDTASGH